MNKIIAAILTVALLFPSLFVHESSSFSAISHENSLAELHTSFPGISRMRDYDQLIKNEYDFLFLSMIPTSSIADRNFSIYFECTEYKAEHQFTTLHDLTKFLDSLTALPPNVYIFLDLSAIYEEYPFLSSLYFKTLIPFYTLLEQHPETEFSLILPYYSLQYLQSMPPLQSERLNTVYSQFMDAFFNILPNVRMYYWGNAEWVTANPANYLDFNYCNPDMTSRLMLLLILNDDYLLNSGNYLEAFGKTNQLIQGESPDPLLSRLKPLHNQFIDVNILADTDIIFFGDSVIGNYTRTDSIPGVVAGLTGARTYNLGIGGTSASANLLPIIDAFLKQDTDAVHSTNAEIGMLKYFDDTKYDSLPRNTVFIINYGLNDYFSGKPLGNPESPDCDTYSGALRCAVEKLREAYPNCRIILNTPSFCHAFSNGSEEHDGYILADYTQAVIDTAKEMNTDYLDNYYALGINADNWRLYLLEDEIHPNEFGRYIIGKNLADFLIGNQ